MAGRGASGGCEGWVRSVLTCACWGYRGKVVTRLEPLRLPCAAYCENQSPCLHGTPGLEGGAGLCGCCHPTDTSTPGWCECTLCGDCMLGARDLPQEGLTVGT